MIINVLTFSFLSLTFICYCQSFLVLSSFRTVSSLILVLELCLRFHCSFNSHTIFKGLVLLLFYLLTNIFVFLLIFFVYRFLPDCCITSVMLFMMAK